MTRWASAQRTAILATIATIDSNGNFQIKGGMGIDSAGVGCGTAEMLVVDGSNLKHLTLGLCQAHPIVRFLCCQAHLSVDRNH